MPDVTKTHSGIIADFNLEGSTAARQGESNTAIVQDIADAIKDPPPPAITGEYLRRCERSAAYLGAPTPPVSNDILQGAVRNHPLAPDTAHPWVNVISPWTSTDGDASSSEAIRNAASRARNNVFDVMNRVSSFVARARNAGFQPPENPFIVIAQLNTKREGFKPLDIDQTIADGLISKISEYVDLLAADSQGKIDLKSNLDQIVQLSSVHISFEGFGGSGDAATDILRFLPDMDAVRIQKSREALAVLDFRKRIPKLLFTGDYVPDGELKGAIVAWRKMPDASGYVLRRRSIFDGREVAITLTNDVVAASSAAIQDYVKSWFLTFYDSVTDDQVLAYLDRSVQPHLYYVYKVQAYQVHRDEKDSVFKVEVTNSSLSAVQRIQVQNLIASQAAGSDINAVSPYPALAQIVLGRPDYDWILAGTNVRESISRSDARSTTRSYSYLNTRLDFLFAQMDGGKFVVPKNPGDVVTAIKNGVASFGVNQILQDILQETGVLFFFDGKDSGDDEYFNLVGVDGSDSSGLLSSVLAAVDPETLTLNLDLLSANVNSLQSNSTVNGSGPTQIIIGEQASTAKVSITGYADLTTFDGIGQFMEAIRTLSDIGSRKNAIVDFVPASVTPTAFTVPPPAPVVAPPTVSPTTTASDNRANVASTGDQSTPPPGSTTVKPSTTTPSPASSQPPSATTSTGKPAVKKPDLSNALSHTFRGRRGALNVGQDEEE